MKKQITFLTAMLVFSLFSFAQYTSLKITCAHENPVGLNPDVEEPATSPQLWTPVSGNHSATPSWSGTKTIPFSFNFNGTNYTSYKVSTTGVLTFDVATAVAAPTATNAALPSALIPDNSICVWGIYGTGANDTIASKTFGPNGKRQHWIWFNSYSFAATGYTYWAIVLEETTNNIYIVDQRTTPATGLSLTLGVQINSTTAYQVAGSPNINSSVTATGSILDDPSDNVYYVFNTSFLSYDVKPTSFSLQGVFPYKAMADGPFHVTGSLINLGSQNLTSIRLNYSVNNGPAVSTIPFTVGIPAGGCYNYSHPTVFSPSAAGWYNFKFWVTDLNSNADQNNVNDTLYAKMYVYNAVPAVHKVVIEEGTGTWCGWCPRGTVYMDSISHVYPNSTVLITVHGGYSPEPMRVAAYDIGVSAMTPGDPYILVDRIFGDDPSEAFNMYDTHIDEFGLGDVSFTVNYNSTTRQSTVDATITSAVDITGDYRLACVYTEDNVTGAGPGNNTSVFDYDQVNYYSVAWNNANGTAVPTPNPFIGGGHNWSASANPIPASAMNYDFVARTIQGGFLGQAGSLPGTMTSGGTYNYSFPAYTIPGGFNDANMNVHVLLIDAENNIIMNGDNRSLISAVGISDPVTGHYSVAVSPNPATDQIFVSLNFKENEKATITVMDILGKVCMSKDLGTVRSGEHRIPVNISSLPEGTYLLSLRTTNGSATTKFIK